MSLMKAHVQMQKAIGLIEEYDCSQPLSLYLKNYFHLHKNMGSRDRKTIQDLLFAYYRFSRGFQNMSLEKTIALCAWRSDSELLREFSEFWMKNILGENFAEDSTSGNKIEILHKSGWHFMEENIFPFKEKISPEIERKELFASIFTPPATWIRCKKKFVPKIKSELEKSGIDFFLSEHSPDAIGFEKPLNLTPLKSFQNGWFEIQDLSSQLTGTLFQPQKQERWWDCCAASGGKSLLLKDIEPGIPLLCTDNRENILQNLKNRFERAGITDYECRKADLVSNSLNKNLLFDGIILDAPCTGSGTWARNPERLSCADENMITHYSALQRKIIEHVAPHLKRGKPLIYITCSVYAEENEVLINSIAEPFGFTVSEEKYLKGYQYKADVMYGARLLKQ